MKASHLIYLSLLASISALNAEAPKAARFSLDNTKAFVEEKSSVLSINRRTVDPFGLPQDLTRKIVKPSEVAPPPEVAETKVLVREEISKLGPRITVLGRTLLIDNKPYQRKDEISVEVKGKTFPLKINSISNKKITFIDLNDKSIITLNLGETGKSIFGNGDGPSIGDDTPDTIVVPDH